MGLKKSRYVVMLGTAPTTMGGVSAVIENYRNSSLFEHWPIIYLATHKDGAIWIKVSVLVNALLQFVWFLAKGNVMLVHVHSSSRASFWRKTAFIIVAFVAHRPVIFHLHGGEFIEFYQDECGPVRQYLVRQILGRVDKIIVLSNLWKKKILKITNNRKILVLSNPVNIEKRSIRKKLSDSNSAVLFLGRISKKKGVYDLLKAISVVRREIPDVKLNICGDGDHVNVRRYAEELGIMSSVNILGWVTGEKKARLLDEASVFVLPSYHEAMPMALLEAMGHGIAVVATRVGSIPEVVEDGKEGYLVEPGNIDELSKSIKRVLADKCRRAVMGQFGREKMRRQYTIESILPILDKLYEEFGVKSGNT